ncbi:MAG: lytic transglycosylase domain-containing protein [Acidobacteriota bacterium]|nr:lytic transglycosylase domain-containing protein [Acidobacteriota bacterium]
MTNCLRLARRLPASAFLLAGILQISVLSAEPPTTRTTLVVRADTRTGRLVRSTVIGPRTVAPTEPTAPVFMPAASQPAAAEPTASSLTELIDAIAAENNVEAPLVHSVIKAESNYNPAAISPKGAQGLMQLIPSTARRFGVSNSFNVQQNIEGGVRYLKFLMDLYHNDYVRVIAAYNAGEGAVARYGGIPPYSETVSYVLRVGRNLKTARQFAELRAADHKNKPQLVETASHVPAEPHSIQAITGDDGRIYYKTQ